MYVEWCLGMLYCGMYVVWCVRYDWSCVSGDVLRMMYDVRLITCGVLRMLYVVFVLVEYVCIMYVWMYVVCMYDVVCVGCNIDMVYYTISLVWIMYSRWVLMCD